VLDAETLWVSLTSSAFVSTAVQMVAKYYFDARLEREKAQLTDLINKSVEPLRASLQQETNRLSAEQTRVTDRLQTMFSTLQTERAQAIKELYAKIVKVESLLNFITVEKTITAGNGREELTPFRSLRFDPQ